MGTKRVPREKGRISRLVARSSPSVAKGLLRVRFPACRGHQAFGPLDQMG